MFKPGSNSLYDHTYLANVTMSRLSFGWTGPCRMLSQLGRYFTDVINLFKHAQQVSWDAALLHLPLPHPIQPINCSSQTPYQLPHAAIRMRASAQCLLCEWAHWVGIHKQHNQEKVAAIRHTMPQQRHRHSFSTVCRPTPRVRLHTERVHFSLMCPIVCGCKACRHVNSFSNALCACAWCLPSQLCLCAEEIREAAVGAKRKRELWLGVWFWVWSEPGPTVCSKRGAIKEVFVSLPLHTMSVVMWQLSSNRGENNDTSQKHLGCVDVILTTGQYELHTHTNDCPLLYEWSFWCIKNDCEITPFLAESLKVLCQPVAHYPHFHPINSMQAI